MMKGLLFIIAIFIKSGAQCGDISQSINANLALFQNPLTVVKLPYSDILSHPMFLHDKTNKLLATVYLPKKESPHSQLQVNVDLNNQQKKSCNYTSKTWSQENFKDYQAVVQENGKIIIGIIYKNDEGSQPHSQGNSRILVLDPKSCTFTAHEPYSSIYIKELNLIPRYNSFDILALIQLSPAKLTPKYVPEKLQFATIKGDISEDSQDEHHQKIPTIVTYFGQIFDSDKNLYKKYGYKMYVVEQDGKHLTISFVEPAGYISSNITLDHLGYISDIALSLDHKYLSVCTRDGEAINCQYLFANMTQKFPAQGASTGSLKFNFIVKNLDENVGVFIWTEKVNNDYCEVYGYAINKKGVYLFKRIYPDIPCDGKVNLDYKQVDRSNCLYISYKYSNEFFVKYYCFDSIET